MKKIFAVSLLALVSFTVTANAQQDILPVDFGWYNDAGLHLTNNESYLTGRTVNQGVPQEFRNFGVFDVSQLGQVSSAMLVLFNIGEDMNGAGGFSSADNFETYSLFDVSTDDSSLLDGSGGVSAFDDLGTGSLYGDVNITSADNGNFVEVELNSAGLAALNSSTGLFVFGGAVTTLDPAATTQELVFSRSHLDPSIRLVVTAVPEPTTMTVLAFVGCLGFFKRRRRL